MLNNSAADWKKCGIKYQCSSFRTPLSSVELYQIIKASLQHLACICVSSPRSGVCWDTEGPGESALVTRKNGPLRWSSNCHTVAKSKNQSPHGGRKPLLLVGSILLLLFFFGNKTGQTKWLLDSTLITVFSPS